MHSPCFHVVELQHNGSCRIWLWLKYLTFTQYVHPCTLQVFWSTHGLPFLEVRACMKEVQINIQRYTMSEERMGVLHDYPLINPSFRHNSWWPTPSLIQAQLIVTHTSFLQTWWPTLSSDTTHDDPHISFRHNWWWPSHHHSHTTHSIPPFRHKLISLTLIKGSCF